MNQEKEPSLLKEPTLGEILRAQSRALSLPARPKRAEEDDDGIFYDQECRLIHGG